MFGRLLVMIAGLSGAAGASQFPEYAQQYAQRLAGAVDELTRVVDDFDADAAKLDLTRQEALTQMQGEGEMARARAETMEAVFDRQEKLTADLAALRDASPVERATEAWRMTDTEVAQKAWDDFKPAIPVTMTGLGFAAGGFVIGYLLVGLLVGFVGLLFRRRSPADAAT